jgi:hypothetical protein
MTVTCSPLRLTLACQDDPYSEIPPGVGLLPRLLYGEVVGSQVFREPNFRIASRPAVLLFFSGTFLVRTAQNLKRLNRVARNAPYFRTPFSVEEIVECNLLSWLWRQIYPPSGRIGETTPHGGSSTFRSPASDSASKRRVSTTGNANERFAVVAARS